MCHFLFKMMGPSYYVALTNKHKPMKSLQIPSYIHIQGPQEKEREITSKYMATLQKGMACFYG